MDLKRWAVQEMIGTNFEKMLGNSKFVGGEMQARIKQLYKKSSLICFCKFLCLVDLRICVCLNKTKPWLELNIKFNQYSIRSFQKALMGCNNLWIHLFFNEFNWISMSKILYSPFQMEDLTKWEVLFFVVSEKIVSTFFSFLINLF